MNSDKILLIASFVVFLISLMFMFTTTYNAGKNTILRKYFFVQMKSVKDRSDYLYEKYGCIPTYPNAVKSMDVFQTSFGNSCGKFIYINENEEVAYHDRTKIKNDAFHVKIKGHSAEGVMKTINGKIIYKMKGLDKELKIHTVKQCLKNFKNDNLIQDESKLSDQNPCGIDGNQNPIIYIGKSKH